jgi:peptidoglycan hydrolase-like amidase
MQIRIWRRALNRVDVVDLEDYIKAVLPSEIFPSWHEQSLRANAILARSYAYSSIVSPRYQNADVDDTTASQVYNPSKLHQRTNEATDATRGLVMVSAETGNPVRAFYSASCGGTGLTGWDPRHLVGHTGCPCAAHGRQRHGHGHGGCQWGTQYLAQQGRSAEEILRFYFKNFAIRGLGDGGGSGVEELRMAFDVLSQRVRRLEDKVDSIQLKEVTFLTWTS